MKPTEIAEALEREQRDLLELLRTLTPEQWRERSLCPGWTVKDVAQHVTHAELNEFLPSLRRALEGDASPPDDDSLSMANAAAVEKGRAKNVERLLADMEAAIEETRVFLTGLSEDDLAKPAWNRVGTGSVEWYARGRIWEWWTHGQDIRVPLKLPGAREPERVKPVVELMRDSLPFVFDADAARGVRVSYAYRVGDVDFTVRIDDGTLRVDDGFDDAATVRVVADPATFVLVGMRRTSQVKAALLRRFKVKGDKRAGLKFLTYFRAV